MIVYSSVEMPLFVFSTDRREWRNLPEDSCQHLGFARDDMSGEMISLLITISTGYSLQF